MKKHPLLLLLLLVWSSPFASAQEASVAAIDQLLSAHFHPDRPGGAVLVAREGKVLYRKGFGLADVPAKMPMQPDHLFRIGSLTKQFTAAAIVQLADQGRLSLRDTITKFLPDYPTHGKTIRIEHLLTHTSGIKNYTDMDTWTAEVRKKDMTTKELVDFFKDQPMDFDPGMKWQYSNSGYILLGQIIEVLSGKPYGQYIAEKIFRPLGLKNTWYGTAEDTLRHRALGYMENENDSTLILPAQPLNMTQPHAAGALISTVDDLYTWTKALYGSRLFSPKYLKYFQMPYYLETQKSTHYGYGINIGNILGNLVLEHGGGINGFSTYMMHLPNQDLTIVMLTNCECERPSRLSEQLAALALGLDARPKPINLDEGTMEEYVGVYQLQRSEERYITLEKGQLYSMRVGGNRYKMVPFAPDEFYLEGTLVRLKFFRNTTGNMVSELALTDRTEEQSMWAKTNKPLPVDKTAIELPQQQLDRLVGKYKLMPEFHLTFTREGKHFFVQATGQPKLEVFATTPTRFFLKEVDAEIEFTVGDAGSAPSMVLRQAGQELVGERVE